MDSVELQPGVVLTIEPGIYIPDEDRYGAYAGIGVCSAHSAADGTCRMACCPSSPCQTAPLLAQQRLCDTAILGVYDGVSVHAGADRR
jgi:hypothetical protein